MRQNIYRIVIGQMAMAVCHRPHNGKKGGCQMSEYLEARLDQLEAKMDLIIRLIDPDKHKWQISDKPITRLEFEYWPNNTPDGTFDSPGFGLKLQQSGDKRPDTYKQLYGKDVAEYGLPHFQELPVNTYLDFTWINAQVSDLRRKYQKHHIAFFHQYYADNAGMEEVFNNFLLVVDRNALGGFVLFRCINDRPIKLDIKFEEKQVNRSPRYLAVLSANYLKPIRTKIK